MDQLRKRSEILGVGKSTLEESTVRDAVLSGKVAVAVFRSAVNAVAEASKESKTEKNSSLVVATFVTSLLGVADEFPFAGGVRKEILG